MRSISVLPDESAVNGAPTTRVAYLMTWFPKLSETFVLYELLAVEREGIEVEVYPLRRGRGTVVHNEARPLVGRAHYTPWLSLTILWRNLVCVWRQPIAYSRILGTLIRENWGSRRYLTGALLYFPKAVYLAWHMQRYGIDHIHAHFASHPAMVAYVVHRLTGIPFSFTAHGSDLHRDRHMLAEKVRRAKFAVTVSEFNRDVILEVCKSPPPRNVRVIHCGVDTTQFTVSPRTQHGSAGPKPLPALLNIYCVGTLHPVKGQTYLLRAAGRLAERGWDFRLRFIGDGPDRAKCEALARELNLTARVEFLGHQTRDAVRDHLQRADIVAVPSVPTADGRREGIPVALMEAMASGAAVVASRLTGIPELVREDVSGLLVTPGNVDELTEALARLLTDAQLRGHLATAARETIETEFNQRLSAQVLANAFVRSHRDSASRPTNCPPDQPPHVTEEEMESCV